MRIFYHLYQNLYVFLYYKTQKTLIMKKTIISVISAITLISCGTSTSTQYTVDASIPSDKIDNKNNIATIIDYDNGNKLDSAVIVNGKAAFAGEIVSSRAVRLQIGNKRLALFFLEPGNITIAEDGTAAGTALNEDFEAYIAQKSVLEKEYRDIYADTTTLAISRKAEIDAKYKAISDSMFNANANNAIGYYMFLQDANYYSAQQLDSALAVNPSMKEYTRIANIIKAHKAQANTSVGNKFVDFEITYDSITYKLSDYVAKGNYTIVDFWASWCGPCIRETATLKEIYKKWNGKGLDIVGVAVWDKPEDTLEAIKQHKLLWKCIINGQYIPTDLYGILGIPCILVIDPEGTIIARNLYGEDLETKINELMSAKEEESKKK